MEVHLDSVGSGVGGVILDQPGPGWRLGWSVGGGGDVNGDGFDDVVVGAPEANAEGNPSGSAFVFFGRDDAVGAYMLSEALGGNGVMVRRSPAEFGGERIGTAVDIVGDMTGDGLAEVAVGAPVSNRTYVVYGDAGLGGVLDGFDIATGAGRVLVETPARFSSAGSSVAAAGDVSGDGLADLLIGAPSSEWVSFGGYAYLVTGDDPITASDLNALTGANGWRLAGIVDNEQVGSEVSGAGDINGDGWDDIVVGTFIYPAGGAYVIFGGPGAFEALAARDNDTGWIGLQDLPAGAGLRISGPDDWSEMGRRVSGAGDLNGDGYDDLVIGAPLLDRPDAIAGEVDNGGAYVLFGGPGLDAATSVSVEGLDGAGGFRILGDDGGGLAGWSVSDAGDVNADGYDDLLIGARWSEQADQAVNAGRVYLIYGKPDLGADGTIDLRDFSDRDGIEYLGGDTAVQAGYAVSAAGDFNDDGFDDIVIGAPGADQLGSTGRAYVVYGAATPLEAVDDAAAAVGRAALLIDPLANDRLQPAAAATVASVADPAQGVAVVTEEGRIVYRADPDFFGTDSFLYTVADATGAESAGTIRVTVAPDPAGPGLSTAAAQRVAYLYEAGLDRQADAAGVNFWIDAREGILPGQNRPLTERALAERFLDSPEFEAAFGNPDTLGDRELVARLYLNVLDRPGEAAGIDYWVGELSRPEVTRAEILLEFAKSAENLAGSPEVATLTEIEPGFWDFAG